MHWLKVPKDHKPDHTQDVWARMPDTMRGNLGAGERPEQVGLRACPAGHGPLGRHTRMRTCLMLLLLPNACLQKGRQHAGDRGKKRSHDPDRPLVEQGLPACITIIIDACIHACMLMRHGGGGAAFERPWTLQGQAALPAWATVIKQAR